MNTYISKNTQAFLAEDKNLIFLFLDHMSKRLSINDRSSIRAVAHHPIWDTLPIYSCNLIPIQQSNEALMILFAYNLHILLLIFVFCCTLYRTIQLSKLNHKYIFLFFVHLILGISLSIYLRTALHTTTV